MTGHHIECLTGEVKESACNAALMSSAGWHLEIVHVTYWMCQDLEPESAGRTSSHDTTIFTWQKLRRR